MAATAVVHFPPFALDVGNEQLWQGKQQIPLRPKPFAILRYLVERPGQLVTKDELLKAIWPQTYVSEGLLHTYLRDLRHVLNDDPESPRFIETIVRRGYRFIAPLTEEKASQPVGDKGASIEPVQSWTTAPTVTASSLPSLVGREVALTALQDRLTQALKGVRQVVFVTGEPGIGKTTLVDAFLEQISAKQGVWIGRGQCVGQYGTGEAYLPLLEALGRLGRTPEGARLVALLRRHAPSWLVQLPALLTESELETLQRKVQGVTRERMLRELAEALEVLTVEHPLMLVLEDLHWSDASTLDLLTAIAQRREVARLLVLGTYRPADVIVSGHPLRAVKQELELHAQCTELPLTFLSASDILQYLAGRFPQSQFPVALAHVLHQHTEGNPLFLVTTVEDLVTRQVIGEHEGQWQMQGALDAVVLGVPGSVQQLIVRHFERLSGEEQEVVEAASVAGESFSATAVAAGLEAESNRIEACCEGLARREQFLRAQELVMWPDGTIAGTYQFVHALYQQVVYERIGAARRMRLHQRIGARLETGYGARTSEIAAELAVHFEQGQDYPRAVQYYEHAGKNAVRRSAHVEAISHLTKGLELLKTLPDSPERTQQELALQMALGAPLMATKGNASPEAGKIYARARELGQQLGEAPQLFPVLRGQWSFYTTRAEHQTARELAELCLHLAQGTQDTTLLMEAHYMMGNNLFYLGEFARTRELFEQSMALYDPRQHHSHAFLYGQDTGVVCLSRGSWVLCSLGYPDQALKMSHKAIALARELSHLHSLAYALSSVAVTHQYRREEQAVQEQAEAAITLATEQGFTHWVAWGTIFQGWALAEQGQGEEGTEQICQGLRAYRATGAEAARPYLLALLAEAYGKIGQIEEGLSVVAEALGLVEKTGERWYEAELYRLRGELLLAQEGKRQRAKGRKSKVTDPRPLTPDPQSEAEACFLKAIEIAQKQQAKSLELRAVMSLSRLWQQLGKKQEAHQMLSTIYGWFTEGFDTKDLQEAKVLFAELR